MMLILKHCGLEGEDLVLGNEGKSLICPLDEQEVRGLHGSRVTKHFNLGTIP